MAGTRRTAVLPQAKCRPFREGGQKAARSIVRLHIHPRAIVCDRRRRRAVVHEVARAQELGRCGDVGVEHHVDHRPADLLDDANADLAAIWRREKREGQDVRRARHRETRTEIGECGRARSIVLDQLPVRMGAALEADADAVHHGGQRQDRGQRRGGPVEAEETHAGRLQRHQREPVHIGEAAEATIAELAEKEGIAFTYMARLMRLTLLSPAIVDAIMIGGQATGLTLAKLMEPFPQDWREQNSQWINDGSSSSRMENTPT